MLRVRRTLGAVAACLLLAGGGPRFLARGGAGTPPPAGDLLSRAVRLAELARRQCLREDACPFSPAGVVLRVGTDPEALATFVRSTIRYVPALGVVRGPEGTLVAGAGGDWDRAVLLRELLRQAGYVSRFAVRVRSPAERAAVVDEFLGADAANLALGAAGPTSPPALPPADPLLGRAGITRPNRALDVARGVARWRRLGDEAYDAAAELGPALETALAGGHTAVGRPFEEWKADLLPGAAEEVMVECGGRLLSPGPGVAPPGGGPRERCDEPPADRIATVTISLSMRVEGEGAPAEPVVLLHHSFPVGSLCGKALRLQVAPDGSGSGDAPPNEWTGREWLERMQRFVRFQAILEVDRLWLASDAFDIHGRTFRVSADGRIEGAGELGGAVGRGFGGLGGGGTKPEEPKTRIAALILGIDLSNPGAPPVEIRRILYGDLRPDVSPVAHSDLLVFGGPSGPATALWRAFDVATANVPFQARILGSGDRERWMRTDGVRMFHGMLEDWQLARLGVADRLLRSDPGLTLTGGEAIALKTTYLVPDAGAGTVRMRTVIDVAHDDLVLRPRDAASAEIAARANLLTGVASTVLESCLVREVLPTAEVRGAYAAFEAGAARGEAPVAVRPGALGGVEPDPLSRWALGREADTALLVFPERKHASSWFSVDPATGRTIGRGGGGEGQSLAEYKAAIKAAFTNLKCMVGVLSGMGSGASAGANSYEWMKCITGFDPEKPSSYVGVAGNYQNTTMGLQALSKLADIMGGCESLLEQAGK